MSGQNLPKSLQDLPDEESVQDYLRMHPNFFDENRALLSTLRLSHASGGGTVSLIEKQVATLRQKNLKLDRQLKELISVARDNDKLARKVHSLTIGLMRAATHAEAMDLIETQLRTSFAADQAVVVLYEEYRAFADLPASRFVRLVSRQSEALKPFETFLGSNKPRCGQVRDSQRDFLFGKDTDEIGSAALVPLGSETNFGFLAIGSADGEHFHPAMSTDFLVRIGDVLAVALERFQLES